MQASDICLDLSSLRSQKSPPDSTSRKRDYRGLSRHREPPYARASGSFFHVCFDSITDIKFNTGEGFDNITAFASYGSTHPDWEKINPEFQYTSADWGYFKKDQDAALVVRRNGTLITMKGSDVAQYLSEIKNNFQPVIPPENYSLTIQNGKIDTKLLAKEGDIPVFCCLPQVHKIKVFSPTSLQEVHDQIGKIHGTDKVSVVVATCNYSEGAKEIHIGGKKQKTSLTALINPNNPASELPKPVVAAPEVPKPVVAAPELPKPVVAAPEVPKPVATTTKSVVAQEVPESIPPAHPSNPILDTNPALPEATKDKDTGPPGILDKKFNNDFLGDYQKKVTEHFQEKITNNTLKDVEYVQTTIPTSSTDPKHIIGQIKSTASNNKDQILANITQNSIECPLQSKPTTPGKSPEPTLSDTQLNIFATFLEMKSSKTSPMPDKDNMMPINAKNFHPDDLIKLLVLLKKIEPKVFVDLKLPQPIENCKYGNDGKQYTEKEYSTAKEQLADYKKFLLNPAPDAAPSDGLTTTPVALKVGNPSNK